MIKIKVLYNISFPEDRCEVITPDENEVVTSNDLMQITLCTTAHMVRNKLRWDANNVVGLGIYGLC